MGIVEKMRTDFKKRRENWRVIYRFFHKYNDKTVVALIVISVLSALAGVGITYLLSHFVNVVVERFQGISREMAMMFEILILAYVLDTLLCVLINALLRVVTANSTERIQGEAIMFASTDDYLHFISKEQKDKHLFLINVSNSTNQAILNGAMKAVRGTVTIIGGIG